MSEETKPTETEVTLTEEQRQAGRDAIAAMLGDEDPSETGAEDDRDELLDRIDTAVCYADEQISRINNLADRIEAAEFTLELSEGERVMLEKAERRLADALDNLVTLMQAAVLTTSEEES